MTAPRQLIFLTLRYNAGSENQSSARNFRYFPCLRFPAEWLKHVKGSGRNHDWHGGTCFDQAGELAASPAMVIALFRCRRERAGGTPMHRCPTAAWSARWAARH
jgi:hypothetical protein